MNLASMRAFYFLIEICASEPFAIRVDMRLKDRGREDARLILDAESCVLIRINVSTSGSCTIDRLGRNPVANIIIFIYTRMIVLAICSQLKADGQNA